jgi:hypothetical protein
MVTDLNTDGADDANLVAFSCTHILRDMIVFSIAVIEPCLAVRRDDCLSSQVDDVCEAPA